MADVTTRLIAKTALQDRPPLTLAGTTLAEVDLGAVHSIAVFPGQDAAVAKALRVVGLAFPDPNRFVTTGAAQLVWTGRDQAFLIGAEPPEFEGAAAVTDQSGGWAGLRLTGPAGPEALMRYVAMDLSAGAFPVGTAARTALYHMQMVLLREAEDRLLLLVFRSMARTAWHEIEVAMRALHARAALV